ncbi:50S ribosomal protein L20 [Candidatus Woesebacteria bacterium GWC2_33_12]|uniref:Large ribosomal subunit protein bL20 n=1 Tax=Candidatus Woesebacteria bacterium GW2011_GWB1_33_22 TaxID=1618566 RepID=A0A0G0A231_9BACT|nr:MAG: 50S ribosomal protein L20 [Candidatus Woesebacteria bacterium GW2011_GWC2_33_12]KKP42458.1 MAG: 50S ribosomal protein L20 [Candidatus Woesebacteria bacterium GW2011_GWA2_33_20]KKP45201.1 MAG: 50S ribosomal protein L20 [Candidatus Woesebacteria bacterium GW2011_GWB1_33_22]KKP46200.1 MAG: 50S ribosomal protein L20 [Microgenomates group bacterium GW2011_GWC1_33_28]KKP50870.1 MAG: 50S ribosomal protein L20 [Candidatus Woesebacteria bacterium GW2011_GWA1_33_33]OGM07626.1 MAG: 50S ribosomal 
MTRVKSKAAIKHRKVLKLAKGYHSARRRRFKQAKEAVMHAGQYAYIGRKLRKRDLRSIWIVRLSATAKQLGTSYSKLIANLKKEKIELDRKILSDIAVKYPEVFEKIVKPFIKK